MMRVVLAGIACMAPLLQAAADEAKPARVGVTLYVSKLGDDSDGTSWAKAFRTVQKALQAVPDDQGGHRVVVRPDTYMEANLWPSKKGAQGAYNALVGDYDGSLGSGAKGWVVIDSSDADKGFKSYDWYGPIRAYKQGWSGEHKEPTFSAILWDRWEVRRIYMTGGDGGLFWDLVDQIEPFTVIVEDCVGIGRAFGGGVGNCLARADEPTVLRRCNLWSLDWWGDTAGAYIRYENAKMPDKPDVYLEDCTLVGPQCSLKSGNPGFSTYSRISVKNCRLVTLNYSQPGGTPSPGIIQSVIEGKYLHVDLEDTTLMGYKVFGVREKKETEKDIAYTTKGSVRACVQFQQDVPKGFLRIGYWPTEVFAGLTPPEGPKAGPTMVMEPAGAGQPAVIRRDMCEVAPAVWKGRLCLMYCVRPAHGGTPKDYYLVLTDVETGQELARFGEGYSLACAYVHNDTFYAFASRFENNDWNDVTMFKSSDLKNWDKKVVVVQDPKEHLFNCSVWACPDGVVMAYETNDPAYPMFTIKFAQSKDLEAWTKVPDAIFGTDRYTACPCIRFANGYYYMLYLEHRTPRWFFQTYIARSKDLKAWEVSGANPVLTPNALDDGINASDPDLIEFGGKSYLYYAVGDQRTWMNIKRAVYEGPMRQFFEAWFADGGIPSR